MKYLRKALVSNPWTTWTGLAHGLLFFLFAGLAYVDPRIVDGLDNWFKPMKFALSIAAFTLTLSLLTPMLQSWADENAGRRRRIQISSAVISLMLWGEILLIGGQAARGVASHFNIYSALDGAIYSAMGFMILCSTVATAVFAAPFFRWKSADFRISGLMLQSIRWGFVLFFLGSIAGGIMSSLLSHSIGEPGLRSIPFLGWSMETADIRLVHFAGLHGIQALPAVALVFSGRERIGRACIAFYCFLFLGITALTWAGLSVAVLWGR